MRPFLSSLLTLLLPSCLASIISPQDLFAQSPERWDDADLHNFITRPEIKAPKYNVIVHKKDSHYPGYFFVAPYGFLAQVSTSTLYEPHQVGPHIYDQDGELVWSGAGLFSNRPIMDFKVSRYKGADHLSFVLFENDRVPVFDHGAAILLDSSYQQVANVTLPQGLRLNIHEFSTLNEGKSAIVLVDVREQARNFTNGTREWEGPLVGNGFQEIDLVSREIKFSWKAVDHVSVVESSNVAPSVRDEWDYFHINSVDKDADGNYLVSARYTDTIYLVSGRDGSIIWRLGGKTSSFEMNGFTFSRQHYAKFQTINNSMTVISFLDNAADDSGTHPFTSTSSSLMIVALNTSAQPMTATLLHRAPRPDGGFSYLRGNLQHLPGGNLFGAWSENGYISEHTPDNEVVYEASFASQRFVSYRAFKYNFTGTPLELPVAKAFASVTERRDLTTIVYISWNGATEVDRWIMHSASKDASFGRVIGSAKKSGFETAIVVRGYHPIIFAEAVDVNGKSLANSSSVTTELPRGWNDESMHVTWSSELQDSGVSNNMLAALSGLALLVSAIFLVFLVRHGKWLWPDWTRSLVRYVRM